MGGSHRGPPASPGGPAGRGGRLRHRLIANPPGSGLLKDFSAPVLAQLQAYLGTRQDLSHVALRQGLAHQLAFLEDDSVELVILNSIVQYFPDTDYLLEALWEAVRITRPGGQVFVGDVRSLPLWEDIPRPPRTFEDDFADVTASTPRGAGSAAFSPPT